MSEPIVTEITVHVGFEGMVQVVKYEYNEHYATHRSQTYTGQWTEAEAQAFYDEKYREIYADQEAKAEAEVKRLEDMRDSLV
jgi:hypothetical protein